MQMYRYSQAGLLHNFAEELHHSHMKDRGERLCVS
jgi:hypothetical protein